MISPLQIENVFAPVLTINAATANARYTETPSGSGWPSVSPPERIFQRDQTIDFTVTFDVSGLMQSLFAGCQWRLNIYLEQYGALDFTLPVVFSEKFRTITAAEATPAPVTYTLNISIPGNTFPQGVYDLVCMVRLVNPTNLPLPVAMFADFQTIEVYGA